MIDFQQFVVWLEQHEKLAGWGQLVAAAVTLVATYFTASLPVWMQRKALKRRQAVLYAYGERLLRDALVSVIRFCKSAERDLSVFRQLETFTFALRQSASELQRFPVAELDDQHDRSLAAGLSIVASMIEATLQVIPGIATQVGAQPDDDALQAYHHNVGRGLAMRRAHAETMAASIGLDLNVI